jgi:chemotaxis protein CheX
MEFEEDKILQIAGFVWESMIGLPVEPLPADPGADRPRSIAACIQIAGAWNGAIFLDCPVEVARLAAAAMFNTSPADATLADLQDSLTELVNMLGGNIKALLPETCFLSLPVVVDGRDYSARVPGTRLVSKVNFSCAGHPISLNILEKIQEQAAAA